MSGVGTQGSGHTEFLNTELEKANYAWKICTWHKNQREMQVGGKPDEVGWSAYEACREHGAINAAGQGADGGALICDFNVNGNKHQARCQFKDIDGNVPDQFQIIMGRQLNRLAPNAAQSQRLIFLIEN